MQKLFFLSSIILIVFLSGCASNKSFSLSGFLERTGRSELPKQSEFPNDGAICLYENIDSKIFFDKLWLPSIEKTSHLAILFLNDKAEEYLSKEIYIDENQELISFHAKTIKPSGEVLELTKKDLHKVVAYGSDFTDSKIYQFTFPGVEPGCVLEYKIITKWTKAAIHSQVWEIQSDIPKLFSRYSVEFPQSFLNHGYGWNFAPVNINLPQPQMQYYSRTSGALEYGTVAYFWEVENIPALYPEPKMPPYDDIAQYLRLDLQYKNWNAMTKKYWDSIKKQFKPQNPDQMRKLSAQITGESQTDEEKIASIFSYLQKNFQHINVSGFYSSLIPNPVDETLKNKYGSGEDVAVAAIVLLNTLGIDAFPALVKTKIAGTLRTNTVMFDFDRLIVYTLTKDKKEYWLDLSGTSCNLGEIYPALEGTTPLLIYKDGSSEFKKIPASTSHENLYFRHLKVQIDSLGLLNGEVKLLFKGNQNLSVRSNLRNADKSDMDRVIQSYANFNLPGIKIDSLRYDDPSEQTGLFKVAFNFSYQYEFTDDQQLLIISPFLLKMESDLSVFVSKNRTQPIRFTAPSKNKDLVEFYYDKKIFSIESYPKANSQQFRLGSFFLKSNQVTPGKIIFNRDCTINTESVIPENYPTILKIGKALTQSEKQSLVLRKL